MGLCQLDGRMECAKKGLVLQECWQGLPTSSWRLRLRGSVSGALEERWHQCHLLALGVCYCSQACLSVCVGHGCVMRWRDAPSSGVHPALALCRTSGADGTEAV